LGKPNEWDLEEAVVQLNRLQYTLETSKRFSRDQGKILELEAKLEVPDSFVHVPSLIRLAQCHLTRLVLTTSDFELGAPHQNQGLDRFSLGETGRTLIREGVLAVTVQRGLTAGWPGMNQHQFFLFNDILLCTLKTTRAFKVPSFPRPARPHMPLRLHP
jgi:hypothetical protein